jgi:acetyltransferase-like isoleucine patch superfamily enzyme
MRCTTALHRLPKIGARADIDLAPSAVFRYIKPLRERRLFLLRSVVARQLTDSRHEKRSGSGEENRVTVHVHHSDGLRERLGGYAISLGVDENSLRSAYEQMIRDNVILERPAGDAVETFVSIQDLEPLIEDPLQRRFYALLKKEHPAQFFAHRWTWAFYVERFRRIWEQIYNIIINKIPSHWVRILWLRAGGMKIGKGSTIWRNTEVLNLESIKIGDDSVVGWHCQLDGRAGLVIGDHVIIASYVIILSGGHDPANPDMSAIGWPIYIDDYAWVATRALIANGARICRGAVVAMGSIVSGREIPPYKVAAGPVGRIAGERPHNLDYKVRGRHLINLLY